MTCACVRVLQAFGMIDVADFAATPDNATDNTEAFTDALQVPGHRPLRLVEVPGSATSSALDRPALSPAPSSNSPMSWPIYVVQVTTACARRPARRPAAVRSGLGPASTDSPARPATGGSAILLGVPVSRNRTGRRNRSAGFDSTPPLPTQGRWSSHLAARCPARTPLSRATTSATTRRLPTAPC